MTPDWVNDAACRGKPIDWFYPEARAGQAAPEARALCEECPVKAECFNYSMEAANGFGLWAGLSPGGRKAVRAQRRLEAERARGWRSANPGRVA